MIKEKDNTRVTCVVTLLEFAMKTEENHEN